MKTNFKLITLALFFSVALTLVVAVPQPAAANEKDSERVTFTEPVTVDSTVLKAGIYKVSWEGPGPEVQVRFIKDSKTVLTTSARIVAQTNPYDGAVEVRTLSDNSKVLEAITWKKRSLVFGPAS